MQISFYGANCFKFKINSTTIVFDDNLKALGGKAVAKAADVVCLTDQSLSAPTARLVFDCPGSYEVDGILITGVAARTASDVEDQKSGTIYKLLANGMSVVITGQNQPALTDDDLEVIGGVDALCVAIGGLGSVDDAWRFIKVLDPSLVIPAYYKQSGLKFSAEWTELAAFIDKTRLNPETVEKSLKLKKADFNTEQIILRVF